MGNLCSTDHTPEVSGGMPEKPNTASGKPQPEPKKPLKVYGHHFNSDTRTVLTLLDISGTDYEFEEIDIFKGKHQEAMYLAKNPLGTIPMMIDEDCQLVGNISIFANYLTLTKPKL